MWRQKARRSISRARRKAAAPRFLASWRLGDLDLAAGTVTDGLQRLEILLRPIYEKTSAYGHFGRVHDLASFTWERTDKTKALLAALKR